MSPRIKLTIAIRLSWLCKLEFLGKRESTYTCLRMGEKHTVKTKEREIRFLEQSFQNKLECIVPKTVTS